MSAAAPVLRLLVTIVQIAALLALAWSAPGAHAHYDCSGHHAHEPMVQGFPGIAPDAVNAEAGSSTPDRASAACLHACCHHVVALAPEAPVQPVRWTRSAGLTPAPEAAATGVTPETLPKPPRSRA